MKFIPSEVLVLFLLPFPDKFFSTSSNENPFRSKRSVSSKSLSTRTLRTGEKRIQRTQSLEDLLRLSILNILECACKFNTSVLLCADILISLLNIWPLVMCFGYSIPNIVPHIDQRCNLYAESCHWKKRNK